MNADEVRQEIDRIEKRLRWLCELVGTDASFPAYELLGRLRAAQAVLIEAWDWLTIEEGL